MHVGRNPTLWSKLYMYLEVSHGSRIDCLNIVIIFKVISKHFWSKDTVI